MLSHGGSYRADDNRYFVFISLCLFQLAFGAVGQFLGAARTYFPLKENDYNIGTFKEKSSVGNYVANSLHLILAMITYPHCRQQTNSEKCSVRHRCLPGVRS